MLLLLRGAFFLGLLILWVWATFDVIRTEETPQYLHKLVWLLLVILFSPLGAVAWIVLGRPRPIGFRLMQAPAPSAPPPDDSPEFLRRVDEEIRRRRRADEIRGGRDAPDDPDRAPDEPDRDAIDEELAQFEEDFRRGDEDEPRPS
jgi:phospholipase D-like protein